MKYRSLTSGKYVSEYYGKRHPKTCVAAVDEPRSNGAIEAKRKADREASFRPVAYICPETGGKVDTGKMSGVGSWDLMQITMHHCPECGGEHVLIRPEGV